jgi:hypothetical protein
VLGLMIFMAAVLECGREGSGVDTEEGGSGCIRCGKVCVRSGKAIRVASSVAKTIRVKGQRRRAGL